MTTSSDTPTHPHLVLASVCLAALILPMSFSGGAVATPAIGRQLGGGTTALTWITNAFMLTFGSLLLAAGALADRWGRKRMFLAGIALFAFVSLALSLARTLWTIDLLRAAQGVGAAASLAGGTSALAQDFTGTSRARAFSLLGTTFGLGLAFGPLIAGGLIRALGWQTVFAAPALIALLALALASFSLRETRAAGRAPMDWTGVATFTASLSLLTLGIIQAPGWGWTSLRLLLVLATGVALLALFVLIEGLAEAPLLDLTLFRFPRFIGVQILPISTCYCFVVLLVLLPLRFIGIEGYDEVGAGLLMLTLCGPMLIAPSLAVLAARRFSAGTVSAIGLLLASGGLIWLAHCNAGTRMSPVPSMLLIGFGTGLPWGLMDGLSVGVVPPHRAGMATGIFSTIRVAGEGVALATVSVALTALVQDRFDKAAIGTSETRMLMAQHLAAGDLVGAARAGASVRALQSCYFDAAATLSYGLSALTFLCAVLVFFFLRKVDVHQEQAAR